MGIRDIILRKSQARTPVKSQDNAPPESHEGIPKELEVKLRLSYYKEIDFIDEAKQVKLVQYIENGQYFVLKTHTTYDINVYSYLANNAFLGVSRFVEIIEDSGKLYIIEEYVSGRSLREILNSNGPLPEERAVKYINQLCDILCPLHRLNPPIVHRDIKPSNLIISSEDKLVLIDFNSAKEIDGTKNQDTELFGTHGYAAPEQYGFGVSKPTADIYAIGVLLNVLLTGKLPKDETYSGKLKLVIEKCTQIDPANRYQSLDELQGEINGTPNKIKPQHDRREWLPPGFRGKNPITMVAASLWYVFIFASNLTSNRTVINSVTYIFFLLLETLLFGNYRNLRSHLPLTNSNTRAARRWGTALWAIIIFIAMFSLHGFLNGIFYG